MTDMLDRTPGYPICQWEQGPNGEDVITVLETTHVIRVDRRLFDDPNLAPGHREGDHVLVLDTAREYRYRYVGPDPDDPERVLLFERITTPTAEAFA